MTARQVADTATAFTRTAVRQVLIQVTNTA
jgi:hypothetical protein